MKKTVLLYLFIFLSFSIYSQDKEKIKGTKIVTVTQKEVLNFENLEVEDNIELFLIKGDKCSVEIEADDNLHDVIQINSIAKTLELSCSKEVVSSKKFSVRVTYTNDFKMLIAKDNANITALAEIDLSDFTIKCFDESKIFAYAKIQNFTLMANDKSKIELNLKSEQATIELSKVSKLKALISSSQLTLDMYQKTNAVVEGDALNLKLRLDNNAEFLGKNLTAKNAEIINEGYANCTIQVTVKASIEASGKSELQLYGDQKTDLRRFTDNAILYKKSLK